jgi:hypothetical protein
VIPEFEAMVETIIRRVCELFPRDLRLQRQVIRRIFAIIRRQLRNECVKGRPGVHPPTETA